MDTPSFGASRVQASGFAARLGAWLVAVAAALALAAAPALASGTTYYVDASAGSDSNSCTSPGAGACLTIGHAISLAASGDTISIAAGTYNEAISTGLNLTFTGAGRSGPNATIIDSTGKSAAALALSGTDTVQHLALTDSDSHIGGPLSINSSGQVTATDIAVTTPGGGTDGIGAGGTSLSLTDSAVAVTNTDANVESDVATSLVVQDGSGINVTAGTLTLADDTVTTSEGIALRIHGNAVSTTVRDSLLESTGTVPAGDAGPGSNEWQTIEAAAGSLALDFDTVVNATAGTRNTDSTQTLGVSPPPADALWVGPISGLTTTINDSVLFARPTSKPFQNGTDIDADENVTASDSAYTTVNTELSATVTAAGTNGNLAGLPGFANANGGDFSLEPGSALLGAGAVGDAQLGELDLGGAARTTTCGGSSIVSIGAYESSTPPCPSAPASGNSTGTLTSGPCLTGAGSGCGTTGVPGLTGGDPQGIVESPDGRYVYVVAQDGHTTGVDVVELARGSGGTLSPLAAPNNCISASSSELSGCGTGSVAALQNGQAPPSIAITPNGDFVYVDNGDIISEFSRDSGTGALTPLPASDCLENSTDLDPSCTVDTANGIGQAVSLRVSPDGGQLYLATANLFSSASGASSRRALSGQGGENSNCNNSPPQFFCDADLAVFPITSGTGVLTVGPCYANTTTDDAGCSALGSDNLFAFTSLTFSPDGNHVYVTEDGTVNEANALSDPPGVVEEFSRAPSTGALTALTGAGACLTAGTAACGTGAEGTGGVAGLFDPQQIVLSPDGHDAYVSSSQYLRSTVGDGSAGATDSGVLADSTITQYSVDPSTGTLSPRSGAACFTGFEEGCPGTVATVMPGLTGAEGLAVSPDGQSVYATADAGGDNVVAEFSRNMGTGTLTPLSLPDSCIGNGTPPGPNSCGVTNLPGVAAGTAPEPGGVLVSADCANAYVLGTGIAELGRAVPARATGCAATMSSSTVGLSATQLTYGVSSPIGVGTTSAAQTITVTDAGSDSLTFSSDQVTGAAESDFAISGDSCSGQTLNSNGTCQISVTFTPAALGNVSATLQINDNASGSPQTVTLTGDGSAPEASPSPSSLTFVAGPSGGVQPLTVTVSNPGRLTLTDPSPSLSGTDAALFTISSDTCPSAGLAAGGSCRIGIAFVPTAPGTFTATLSLADNASNSPQTVGITGNAAFNVQLGSTRLTYPDQPLGIASPEQTVSVTNDGRLTVATPTPHLSGPAASAFAIASNSCSGGLAPGASCAIAVTFKPTADGGSDATLSIADNAPDSPQTVALSGIGVTGDVSGIVHDATKPLSGVGIYACPSNALESSSCVRTTTNADGDYGFALEPGSWLLQVNPPNTNLIGASATVAVTKGTDVEQDFALSPPVGLNYGMAFNGQTSGVPTGSFDQPYALTAPLPISQTGTPNTTQLFTGFAGIQGGQQSSQSGQQFIQMAGIVLAVRYGANGAAEAISPPVLGTIPCQKSQAATAQCAMLASIGGGSSSAAGTARATSSPVRSDDLQGTSVPPCPPGIHGGGPPMGLVQLPTVTVNGQTALVEPNYNVDSVQLATYGQVQAAGLLGPTPPPLVQPGANGGFILNVTLDDGTTIPIEFSQAQIPNLPPSNPWSNAFINLANAGLNTTPAGTYNTVVGTINALSTAAQNGDQQAISVKNALWNVVSAGLGSKFHGGASFFWNLFSGDVSQQISAQTTTALPISVTGCIGADGNIYFDPSGQVHTKKGIPVARAKVTLERASKPGGRLKKVPNGSIIMSPGNRHNASFTDQLGDYGWDVLPGQYEVTAQHHSCAASNPRAKVVASKRLSVPPAATGVNLTLNCPSLKRTTVKEAIAVRAGKTAVGEDVITATLHGRHGVAQGFVTFLLGRKVIGTSPIVHGQARTGVPARSIKAGTLVARYRGDATYMPATARHHI